MRHSTGRKLLALAVGSALLLAAACGGGDGKGSKNVKEGAKPLIFGTTEKVPHVDPAFTYDWGGSLVLTQIGQTLLEVKPGAKEATPDAAEKCDWENDKLFTCTLKKGLKFSDGSALDSEDVKFGYDRMLKIYFAEGPAFIYQGKDDKGKVVGGVTKVEAPDKQTVKFHLLAPDASFPLKLTHQSSTIVPSDKYSATKEQTKDLVGSGPYMVTKMNTDRSEVEFKPNPNYKGDKKLLNKGVRMISFKSEASLKSNLESGAIHVAFKSLGPTLVKGLKENGASKGVKVVQGSGVAINYIVFNHKDPTWSKKPIRQAFSYLIDRETIAKDVFDGVARPLYTMVPSGFTGVKESFKDKYGTKPDPAKAKALLRAAGVKTPVKLQLWWNPDHYSEVSGDMFQEIERQVEKGGLFDVTLKNAAWDTYQTESKEGTYKVFQLGWYPDYPDPDNYISPFFATGNFIGKGQAYSSKEMDKLISQELAETDETKRQKLLDAAQDLSAEDVPTLPLIEEDMVAGIRDGVTGVDDTFDAAYTIRFWLIDPSKAKK